MAIKKVLVVDDSATDRHVLSEILARNGYLVSTADNAEEAMTKCRATKPDLILMDVVMPGENGFHATRALSRDQETSAIPIIICSTKSQPTDRIWGLKQGARDYIVKPVVESDLLKKIAAVG